VVFATETLAVGVNMPARSVVIEKLTKFTGDRHERLSPGEYTQLTGRAGRRGIDEVGDAIVLWSPWVPFHEIAELARSTSFHLRSAFRPTYNMAANLVRTYDPEEAHHLLNLSFAQFQADRDVVRLEARIERRRQVLADARAEAESPFGDITEYRRLHRAETEDRRARRTASEGEMRGALARLRPGAVIRTSDGRPAAVIASAHRKAGVRLTLVDSSGRRFHVDKADFDVPPTKAGTITMPSTFAPNRKDWLREIGHRVSRARLSPGPPRGRGRTPPHRVVEEHPVARDPELLTRLRAAAQAERAEREIRDLERRVGAKSHSLARDFDRVLDLLAALGYVDRERFQLTAPGSMLAGIFHESDLLVAEVVRHGLLDELGAPDLAALVSCLVYEHRSPDPPPAPWFSSGKVRSRWRRIMVLSDDLAAHERSRQLAEHRPPDPTFAATAHAWVAGEGFAEVVVEEDLTGGDFVRTMRQLIDLLRQIALVATARPTRRAAAAAVAAADRGVVADTSVSS
jgi:ATP-dependent RNA helicase HelY